MRAAAKWTPLKFYQTSFIVLCLTVIISLKMFFNGSPLESLKFRERVQKLSSVFSSARKQSYQNGNSTAAIPSCIMPQTAVWPKYFKNRWRPKSMRNMCAYESRLAIVEDERELVLTSGSHKNTCFMEVIRGENDQNYTLSKCLPLKSTIHLETQSAILITNGTSINMEVNLVVTPAVHKKLKHWETKHAEEFPISVLMFGVDTTSRAHVYRSLPKSLNMMKRLKFTDFKGYHSLAPNTLNNFMALLMGLHRGIVRSTCSPTWTAPFDPCPLIWKNFSGSNYVTMFMEDGDQSFNWGGKSGFNQQPTDYYWHHLFLALGKLRGRQFKTQQLPKNFLKECASNESVGQFIIRTTKRFVEKFKHVPFFAFSWCTFPFHSKIYALATMDDSISDLLKFLESQPALLRRTLIVFLSDHGDRLNYFYSRTAESFIERGSIPLFIRMPEVLTEKYPDAFANLQANSNKFVTPFDVHHTLLHVLQKDFRTLTPHPGPPHPPDERSSLFLPLSDTRTCAKNHIPAMNCLCNIKYSEKDSRVNAILHSDNKLRQIVLQYAVKKLNEVVEQSKYAKVCKEWKFLGGDEIIRIGHIGQTKDLLEFVLAFSVLNTKANFDARLKLDLRRLKKMDVEKALDFVGISRSSKYGNQSWCIEYKTDEDKRMKGFCYCSSSN